MLAMIADGGMGTVFLAEHMLIKRRVAVKVLHRDLAADRDMVQRFMNEASAASKLGHPNIVESTDMGFTRDHIPFIVFEYLEGALLTEEIYRVCGSVRRALRIAKQIASALEASHGASIVHLDLKSDNIFLIDKDGTSDHAKELDFGIARFTEPDSVTTQREVSAKDQKKAQIARGEALLPEMRALSGSVVWTVSPVALLRRGSPHARHAALHASLSPRSSASATEWLPTLGAS